MRNLFKSGLIVFCFAALISAAQAETLIFSDDFSRGFGANWTTGTNTSLNNRPEVSVQDARVAWQQGWDYIETVQSFEEPFRVEVDLERTQGSVQCKDFAVELVGAEGMSGVLRLGYGNQRWHTINLGQAPSRDSRGAAFQGVCARDDSGYMAERPELLPHRGTLSLTYQDNQVKVVFRNQNGETIETPWKHAGSLGARKIAIWATSKFRFVDSVRVYSLSGVPDGECAYLDMSNLNIVLPCLMIEGAQYRLRLLYDPNVSGGIYWKLDESSLEFVR